MIASEVWSLLEQAARCVLPAAWIGAAPATTHGSSRWARSYERHQLGRLASAKAMHPDGIVIGWLGRHLLQTPAEDNLLLFGVQRSGKTSAVVVPTLLSWRGAVVATSTKEELVRLTARYRSRLGPVWVFAPLDRDAGWIQQLGLRRATWNPLAETSSAAAAAELADVFTADGRQGSSTHWYLSAASLLTGLFLEAHHMRQDVRSVLTRLNTTQQAHYATLAAESQDRTGAEVLTAFAQTPEREAGSIASTARSSLSLWVDDRVASATRSDGPDQLDLEELLEQGGSLYLVAPAEEAERCRPLFSALLQCLLRLATARARQRGGVLHPRLLLALDEVANFARLPRLSGYVSTGPGQGIQLLLCFHDLAQLQAGYGPEAARTIWNNCRARLLLPGQGDLETLERFSRAIGEETRVYTGSSKRSATDQRVSRPLISVDELRRLRKALLLYASSPPAQLGLQRWDQVPDWRELVTQSRPATAGHSSSFAAQRQRRRP